MNTRFTNARILTMEDDCNIFIGELCVSGNTITYVGKNRSDEEVSAEAVKYDRVIDCKGNLLMPGFKDAHTHSAMTGIRSYAEDLPLQEWLETMIWPMEANFDENAVYEFSRLANLEYLAAGITGIFDMYKCPEATIKACTEMGMRLAMCCDINKFGPEYSVIEDRYYNMNGKHELVKYMMGFHGEYTCDRPLLEKLAEFAHLEKAPMYTHSSETEREVAECIERYGMTPTELFDQIGLYDFGGGAYHCCHMSDKDIEIFKNRGLSVVSNPASNAKLASGVAPLKRFLDEGINVALGTDGPSSNNCLDMFREMFLASSLAKLREKDAAVISTMDVLKMATVNGAKAMYYDDIGTLTKGMKADIIMLNLRDANMQPLNDIVAHVVYSGQTRNVKMTMINGVILYEDGKYLIDVDPDEIYDTVNHIMDGYKNKN